MAEETTTMKEDLGAAWDQLAEAVKSDPESGEEASEEVVETPAEEGEVEPQEVAAEDVDTGEEEGADVELEAQDDETTAEDTDETVDDPLDPLAHWHKEDKEAFAELPRTAQEVLIKRDKEFQASVTKKQMEVADIKRSLDPVREQLQEHGIADADAIRRLVGAHLKIVKDPKAGITALLDQYGITYSDILGDKEGDVDNSDTWSSDSAAMRKIQQLEEKLAKYEKQTLAQQADTVSNQIREFAAKNEFFDKVEGEMAMIARSYQAQGQAPPPLAEMYEKACWMNDEVRAELSKRHADGDAGGRDKERVRKAKKAAKTKVASTSRTSKQDDMKPKTLREELSSNFDKAKAR